MGSFSIWHLVILAVIVLLLFGGRGKLSGLMGDAAKGVRAFRDGLKGEEEGSSTDANSAPLPKPDKDKEKA
jgi:sec-independent protein translocase protein TatA